MRSSRFASPLVAAILAALCTLLLGGGRAQAYCREVTDYPPNGYDPVEAGCFTTEPDGGALSQLFWRNHCVSYSFQQQGSKYISMSDAEQIAGQAFGAWSNASCGDAGTPSIQTQLFPPVNCDGANGSQGHSNLIVFRDDEWTHDDSANVIGYTTLTVDLTTGEMFGAEIEINTHDYTVVANLADAGPPRQGTELVLDLGTILTHEAGHFLGLAHSADTSAVMYAHYQAGTTTLTPDDVSGICAMYQPGDQHSTSDGLVSAPTCMPTPPLGFLPTECGQIDSGTLSTVGSGSIGDAGADPAPCTTPSCSLGRGPAGPAGLELCVFSALALGALARRGRRAPPGALARRGRRASRGSRRALVLGGLAIVGAAGLIARDAAASVSVSALFEELVQGSTAAAVVTPIERQGVWEGGLIATYTRVHVDQVLGGALPDEVWVRTLGGAVGKIGQIVEGEAQFPVGQPSLVFVRPHVEPRTQARAGSFVVVERAQGQFTVAGGAGDARRLAQASDLGSLVAPPPSHWARAAQRLPPGIAPRFAHDVLDGRSLRDAAHEIASAWARMHP
jgi:hypothetical protein